MRELRLTRAEYDRLVERHPLWMRDHWLKLERRWDIGGVTIEGSPELVGTVSYLNGGGTHNG